VLPAGRIKERPEDFVVDEIPSYSPSGEGDHLYIHFRKRNITTDAALRVIAGALGVKVRDCGVAGMKDKVGVTSQWMSAPLRDPAMEGHAKELALDGITILEARRHTNKLKTGHLKGNRFEILIRGLSPEGAREAAAKLEAIGREGVPNAFGFQRFGRDGDNAERAKRWLRGEEAGPRDPRQKRFLWSALQSAIFNEVLEVRVNEGSWCTALEGDVLQTERGGLFVCTDVQTDRERAARGEVSPTGPMVGVKMSSPTGRPLEIEQAAATKILGEGFDLASTRAFGEGTRRGLRLVVQEMRALLLSPEAEPPTPSQTTWGGASPATKEEASLRVYFVLPKGSYATTVLEAAIRLEQGPESAAPAAAEPDDA
jgi:tRNA pseudouridine13 synthase